MYPNSLWRSSTSIIRFWWALVNRASSDVSHTDNIFFNNKKSEWIKRKPLQLLVTYSTPSLSLTHFPNSCTLFFGMWFHQFLNRKHFVFVKAFRIWTIIVNKLYCLKYLSILLFQREACFSCFSVPRGAWVQALLGQRILGTWQLEQLYGLPTVSRPHGCPYDRIAADISTK